MSHHCKSLILRYHPIQARTGSPTCGEVDGTLPDRLPPSIGENPLPGKPVAAQCASGLSHSVGKLDLRTFAQALTHRLAGLGLHFVHKREPGQGQTLLSFD